MYGNKVKLRAIFVSLVLLSVILSIFIFLKVLEDNVVYFLSPTEIYEKKDLEESKKIRIGGMVKKDSIKSYKSYISFIITDYKNEINVTYGGSIPNLFAEGKGVVAEGILKDKKYFIAKKILAKHDENYMPPKIDNSLESK
tara:strand:+ start:1271 stop:1693 length:423 start_codon:yes stop_codon:yes gene_type:complete